jgi:hypothetical protein
MFANFRFSITRKRFLNLTKRVNEKSVIKLNGDIFLSGSDQIWGGIGTKKYDLNYFLKFTNSKNKIAYSSSFGHTNLDYIDQEVIAALKDFKFIGVREQSGVDFLKSIGIESELVLDPVFLYDKKYYLNIIKQTRDMKKDYILVYQLHKNPEFKNYLKTLSLKYKLPVYRVYPNSLHGIKYGKMKATKNPFRFLGYINNAKFIVTDSFHCTSFSVILNKPFVSINPGKTNTRIESLLNCLNIKDRLIDFDDTNTISQPIDYEEVNVRLDVLKKDSILFLTKELMSIK